MLKTFEKDDVKGKKVLLRLDLNVPLKEGRVLDQSRILAAIPTLKDLQSKGARIIILSHLGRPNPNQKTYQPDASLSLTPIKKALEDALEHAISFCEDTLGDEAKDAINTLKDGDILLLENVRFHGGDETNDPAFVKELARLGDVFINDAFAVSHRNHGSVAGLAKVLPAFAGPLMHSEIQHLTTLLSNKAVPKMAIIGGAKISSKIGLLKTLVQNFQTVAVGGGIANTFLKANGIKVGHSLVEDSHLETALLIQNLAKDHNCKLILPTDVRVTRDLSSSSEVITTSIKDIQSSESIFDVGPKTAEAITNAMERSKTVVWNGPLGLFEHQPFDRSSILVAQGMAHLTLNGRLQSIVGGGETVALMNKARVKNALTYISTGGGAFLEFIEGKDLPGIKALA